MPGAAGGTSRGVEGCDAVLAVGGGGTRTEDGAGRRVLVKGWMSKGRGVGMYWVVVVE